MEELQGGGFVDGEVVDGFVGEWGGAVGEEAGLWEHGHDCAGVGEGEGFSLMKDRYLVVSKWHCGCWLI